MSKVISEDDAFKIIADLQAMVRMRNDRIQELEKGLRELEDANEAVATARTQKVYLAMIDAGMDQDTLLRLDRARSAARALLNPEEPG